MCRCQVNRFLTRDKFGGLLEQSIAERRLKELFDYYGGTFNDVIYECTVAFSLSDIEKEELDLEWTLVFLAKHGNCPPQWTEQQDLERLHKLVLVTTKLIEAQYGLNTPKSDDEKEWV